MADKEQDGLFINGELVTMESLSYREQREARELIRGLVPNGDLDEATEMDIIPALVCVVQRRSNPEFSIDEALDLKPEQLEPPAPNGKAKRPPRKAAASST